jgi:hypothetical protein
MSNREVAGLQALAQKHGGQLSVNPDTGLPEAGFLDNILPMVAGAGISYFSGGTIDPMTAAGIVGGITALDSKDLSKGLVAGLGAYGGAGMVGGLAGLGAQGALAEGASYGAGVTGEAARQAATQAAIADGTYQSAVGAGAGNFASAPMSSLSALGGGSAIKGSLPILAGLAPAAAEAFDEEDEDKPPEQHKGYIRKYALDPVTGQYKQVGAYEAGGDPNVDVTAKAGTAGAFGGVGQSEYEAAQGMADGGTTSSDSSRIYDYLMGRGPNPMQFTRTAAPATTVTPTPAPITPTTSILEPVYDPYGNIQKGGYYDPEKREAELNAVNDYLNVNNDGMTLNKYFDLSPKDRADLDAAAAKASPIRAGIGTFVKELGTPMIFRGLEAIKSMFPKPVDLNQSLPSFPVDQEGNYITAPLGQNPSAVSEGTLGELAASNAKADENYSPPQDPAQRQGQGRGDGSDNGGRGVNTGGYSNSLTRSSDNVGGSMAAHGGYLQHGQFDQHMAHGGIANLHQYNLGSYSDGGRLLKGPGDGVSDDIPATIGHGQPARLADGEFVIPARIVSEIGNGSTDAGARELYKMMDRVQAGRRKTVGKDQVAKNSKAVRHLPA